MRFLQSLFKIIVFTFLTVTIALSIIQHDRFMKVAQGTGWYLQGEWATLKKDYPRANRYFRAALKLFPEPAHLLIRLAETERVRGRWEQSNDYYRLALEYDPENSQSYHYLGVAEWKAGNHRLGYDMVRRAYDRSPHTNMLQVQVSQYAVDLARETRHPRDFKNAETLLKAIIKDNGDDDFFKYALAELYFIETRYGDAMDHYCKLAQKYPNSSETFYSLAQTFLKSDDPRHAYEYMSRAAVLAIGDRPKKSDVWAKKAIQIEQTISGEDHHPSASALRCAATLEASLSED